MLASPTFRDNPCAIELQRHHQPAGRIRTQSAATHGRFLTLFTLGTV
jgi:hypothetical protein